MSVINPAIVPLEGDRHARGILLVTWGGITENDTCAPVQCLDFADRSVQMEGTWGGAAVALQGSNSGIAYANLTDPQGNPISKTADALEAVTELTRYAKPVTSGGTGSSVTVTMLVRKGS